MKTTTLRTTIRHDRARGCTVIRLWDVYRQQWAEYSAHRDVPAAILASLPLAERARIARAQARAAAQV
jgi:hypothetical protein